MSQNAPEGSQKLRQTLDTLESVPQTEILSNMFSLAMGTIGLSVEQPWVGQGQTFVLTARCDVSGKDPLWTLYEGVGDKSQVVWTNVERDTELIYDVLCMATSSAKSQSAPPTKAADLKAHIPYDMSLLEKQPNILLGHLLVEAGLISEPNLEQALKLQELVRDGKLTESDVYDTVHKAFPQSAGDKIKQSLPPPSAAPAQSKNTQKVVDLLKQSGLISEQDIQLAVLNWLQAQGNLGTILVSTGKVDNLTLDAAATCVELIQRDKMKTEQAIIALHYCSRSRVSFDDAVSEMGWENPRK